MDTARSIEVDQRRSSILSKCLNEAESVIATGAVDAEEIIHLNLALANALLQKVMFLCATRKSTP